MIKHTSPGCIYQRWPIDIATEDDLIDAARLGDKEAFVELWNHHSNKVFGTIFRIVKNREDAEDLLQEACLKSFINIHRFDGRSQIYTWITSIAINATFMALRRKRIRQESSMVTLTDEDGWRSLDIADESVDIEDNYLRSERAALLWQAIRRLSPKRRMVLEMYLSQDMSINDIAKLSGTSVAAAKSRLSRARVALNRSLGGKLHQKKSVHQRSVHLGDSENRGVHVILHSERFVGSKTVDAEVADGATRLLPGTDLIVVP